MEKFSDKKIVDSWNKNVPAWISAVREGEIESRLLITNNAIVDVVVNKKPSTVLDIGCGEGWLVRELASQGISVLGIDVVPDLIRAAEKEGAGRYRLVAYEDLCYEYLEEAFDVLVCNFSLLGDESVVNLFQQAPRLLNAGGALIVQTIHPIAGCGDAAYQDGWREGSWNGFTSDFCDPAPWYFRTMESWRDLFLHNGFSSIDIVEPINPKTNAPASVVFTGTLASTA